MPGWSVPGTCTLLTWLALPLLPVLVLVVLLLLPLVLHVLLLVLHVLLGASATAAVAMPCLLATAPGHAA